MPGTEYLISAMNHLFYADDAVLLAPTVDALQKLIDVCQEFARKGDMVYNFEKSECTAFIPNTLGHMHTPDAYLGDKKLNLGRQKRYLGVLISRTVQTMKILQGKSKDL